MISSSFPICDIIKFSHLWYHQVFPFVTSSSFPIWWYDQGFPFVNRSMSSCRGASSFRSINSNSWSKLKLIGWKQWCGSESSWIRINLASRFRIRVYHADPDPGSKKSVQIMGNSCILLKIKIHFGLTHINNKLIQSVISNFLEHINYYDFYFWGEGGSHHWIKECKE